MTRITGTLHGDLFTFMIISRCIPLRMINVTDKSCTENQNKHFTFKYLFLKNHAIYEIMWETTAQRVGPLMKIQYGACALHATDTHSEYVILIAFPQQQWLRKSTSFYVISTSFVLLIRLQEV
jgi:hypothetical protein